MSAFNSLGSNYTLSFAIKALLSPSRESAKTALVGFLEKRYAGKAYLTYKGREALELALGLIGQPDACVAINGFTCFAVYQAIRNAGHPVHYLDIEPGCLDFSPKTLRDALSANPHIQVVVVQNTLGYARDIREISRICKENGLLLIEDLAHSIGARYPSGEEAGTVGDFVILSFSQDKVVDGISGGALVVRNPKYVGELSGKGKPLGALRQLKDRTYPILTWLIRTTHQIGVGKVLHRMCRQLHLLPAPVTANQEAGFHELPAWYCGLIHAQFTSLVQNLEHKRKIAQIYAEELPEGVLLPEIAKHIPLSASLRFPIVLADREGLIRQLHAKAVYVSDIWYDAPVAPKKYLHLTDYTNQCPVSEHLSSRILNLPTHINVSQAQAKAIAGEIRSWLEHNAYHGL
jgi:perosamine synthetase